VARGSVCWLRFGGFGRQYEENIGVDWCIIYDWEVTDMEEVIPKLIVIVYERLRGGSRDSRKECDEKYQRTGWGQEHEKFQSSRWKEANIEKKKEEKVIRVSICSKEGVFGKEKVK
jgi:hypothetical protein